MLVLHANWSDGALHVWAEDSDASATSGGDGHPFAATAGILLATLRPLGVDHAAESERRLLLPTIGGAPMASPRMAHALGHAAREPIDDETPLLKPWTTPTARIDPADAEAALDRLDDAAAAADIVAGSSVRWLATASRLARAIVAEERVTPMLLESDGGLRAAWQPWLSDGAAAERVRTLVDAAPAAARAAVDVFSHDAWRMTEDLLWRLVDARVRRALRAENMVEAIDGRDPSDGVIAWLAGLLDGAPMVGAGVGVESARTVRQWIARLDERGARGGWRVLFSLDEPGGADLIPDLRDPGDEPLWALRFALQAEEEPDVVLPADEAWSLSGDSAVVGGRRVEAPQETLLAGLGRAAKMYPRLERALEEAAPTGAMLTTREAYEFLREVRPILLEQGFGVEAPDWWDAPGSRLGARLQIDSEPLEDTGGSGPGSSNAAAVAVGLEALVDYHWQIAVGETTLTLKEFESLVRQRAPLVRVGGRWVEIRQEDVNAALRFIRESPGGRMRVSEVIRLAYGWDAERTGMRIAGIEATGWVAGLFGQAEESLPILRQPGGLHGALRPYQVRGLSWLAFLDRFGLGACLADDMGLGKTVQLLALLLHERERHEAVLAAGRESPAPKPTLIVAPMSVIANWQREAHRFAPALNAMVHHGADRLQGEALVEAAGRADMVITTYALAHRDHEDLSRIEWGRIALDEAQNVKNPSAKQSAAVRDLRAGRRVALTGTPVENRLTELWSVMDFCNPGLLGSMGDFRRRFAVPIERNHDRSRSAQLRALVQPFVLRRLKSDPTINADLPEKVETKEFCRLTPEQASLYESTVKRMLSDADQTEGMQRRGLVLASLVRLKQICNHPAQALRDEDRSGPISPSRSGKCIRLLELLEEVLASGEQALIFTQFRQMAIMLAGMLTHELDRETLLFHGGTPQKARQEAIDRFQRADGSAPLLVVSLKAAGVGLNLTAASHVFHFDRWWNPAVENQATDRAHRIGQTRSVQVHKFVVGGTLEERIDKLIEQKTELAETIIASGEQFLSELTTSQLRDFVTLAADAVDDEREPSLAGASGGSTR